MRRAVISPRALARLLDALALFVERTEEQDRVLRLCPICRRETGVEDHRARCAYAAAKDVLLLVAASSNRPDTVDEATGAVSFASNPESL